MRLFAAVVPPSEAIDDLDRAAAPVRAAAAGLRWIPTERWHLTLAFYGEVADRDVARVERRGLRATRDGVALDLRFAGGGHFGTRVLWVGVQGDRVALRRLAGRLATDGRPYRPHLTLARARSGGDSRTAVDAAPQPATQRGDDLRGGDLRGGDLRGGDLRAAVTMLAPYDGPVWRASEVVLFCSHLTDRSVVQSRQGANCGPKPRHEPIARWPLSTAD